MKTDFVKFAKATKGEIEFYDSNTGKLLYSAPRGRSMDDFLKESKAHGWPSFRDAEVSVFYILWLNGMRLSWRLIEPNLWSGFHYLGKLGLCPVFAQWRDCFGRRNASGPQLT